MKGGVIKENGSYDGLMDADGGFADLMRHHLEHDDEEDEAVEEELPEVLSADSVVRKPVITII